MTPTDPVEELLAAYLNGRDRPDPPSAETLCRDVPGLLRELRRRIAEVESAHRSETPADQPTRLSDRPVGVPEFPARLGEYAVRGMLGRGGMGAVLLAEDTKLGRRVAIKVMLPRLAADPAARDRFLREARSAAAVHHDHVVPIFHVGEQDGTPFLVMPLLEGESLDARLRRERVLPPDEVIRVGREAALGLAAAHEKGLVHRDVKPANLWLEAPTERVKVLDFGLARAADGDDLLTHTGAVLGTPAYMAPEQADGEPVDARADLFSLGATLYQAVTGESPFRRPTLTAVLRAVADYHPPAPHEVSPTVPRGLSDLVMRLLAKDTADRPPSARAVADEFARLVAAAPEPASTLSASPMSELRFEPVARWESLGPPVSSRERQPRPQGRRRLTVGCTVTISLCLLVGIGLVNWGMGPEEDMRSAKSSRPVPDVFLQKAAVPPASKAVPPDTPYMTEPLKGSVDLLVSRQALGGPPHVRLGHEAAMPLQTGDQFRIVAEVNRPAYLYLFWIDANGIAAPVYPWRLKKWGTRPTDERMVSNLVLPEPDGKGFEIAGDASGMETIVMLAQSTKLDLPDAEVRAWFAGLKPLAFRGERDRVWFENFEVQEFDPTGQSRSTTSDGVTEKDTPRGQQAVLKWKVGRVQLARAVSFARIGRNK